MGRIAAPALIASAAAPMLGTWLIAALGPQGTLRVLASLTLLPVAAVCLLHATHTSPKGLQPDGCE